MAKHTSKQVTQEDVVRQREAEENRPATVTEKLALPGLKDLHTKSFSEVAEVLTNVLKARKGLLALNWVLGEKLEVTYTNPRAPMP